MLKSYTIEPIGARTIAKAYPLAKIMAPDMRELEWEQFCQARDTSIDRPHGQDGERVVVALNAKVYVKGLCIYAVRDHAAYGRVVDVPVLVAASAADGEGVAAALLDFLRAKCDEGVCSGVRFWTMNADTWSRRLNSELISGSDHGAFLPALASAAEFENALRARVVGSAAIIDQFSR